MRYFICSLCSTLALFTLCAEESLAEDPDFQPLFAEDSIAEDYTPQTLFLEDVFAEDDNHQVSLADETSVPESLTQDCNARPMRVEVHHIEGKGIGYTKGYTSLEGFFGRRMSRYLPFIDLRGHVFDDGKFAANAGMGLRYLSSSWVFGGNVYYDYRQTHHTHFNEIGLGLETLGKRWEFRVNGYLPVGAKKSPGFHKHKSSFCEFKGFEGNLMLVDQITIKKKIVEEAMKGIDAEAEYHLFVKGVYDVYGAAGPYYFVKDSGGHAVGGKARLGINITEYLRLEAIGSFDNLFHGIAQGLISVNIPFGKKLFRAKNNRQSMNCNLATRFIQPVQRDEIIVVGKHHHKSTRHQSGIAVDSITGAPLNFIFVNNTNPNTGDGTFENPFNQFANAQTVSSPGSIFYVFPGDGTTTGLDAGTTTFQLLDNQQVISAGITQLIASGCGTVGIPAQSSGLPHFTSTPGTTVFFVRNHNTLSGLHISVDGAGEGLADDIGTITPNITGLTVINNVIDNIDVGGYGVNIPTGIGGTVNIANNIFNLDTAVGGVFANSVGVTTSYSITGNQFFGFSTTLSGITIDASTNSNVSSFISNNILSSFVNNNIHLDADNNGIHTGVIQNNTLTNAINGVLLSTHNTAAGNFSVLSNNINGGSVGGSIGILISVDNSSAQTILVQNNSILNNVLNGIDFETFLTASGTCTIKNNIFNGNGGACLTVGHQTSNIQAIVENNSFLNSTGAGINLLTLDSSAGVYDVESNIFTNNAGGNIVASFNTSNLCVRFLNNQSTTDTYNISANGASVCDLEPLVGNTPVPTTVGTTPVPANTCP